MTWLPIQHLSIVESLHNSDSDTVMFTAHCFICQEGILTFLQLVFISECVGNAFFPLKWCYIVFSQFMFIVLLISYKMMAYFAAPSIQLNSSGLNGTENSHFFIDCVETSDAYPLVKIYDIFVGEEKINLVNFCFVLRWSNKLNRIFEMPMLLHLHFAYIMNAFLKICLLGNESEFWS